MARQIIKESEEKGKK